MSSPKVLFGFHAVGVRLKTAPQSIVEVYFDPSRRDARMRQFVERIAQHHDPHDYFTHTGTATSLPLNDFFEDIANRTRAKSHGSSASSALS